MLSLNDIKKCNFVKLRAFLLRRGMFEKDKSVEELKCMALKVLLDEAFEKAMETVAGLDRKRKRAETAKLMYNIFLSACKKIDNMRDDARARAVYNLLREAKSVEYVLKVVKALDEYEKNIKYMFGQ